MKSFLFPKIDLPPGDELTCIVCEIAIAILAMGFVAVPLVVFVAFVRWMSPGNEAFLLCAATFLAGIIFGWGCARRRAVKVCRVCKKRREDMCASCAQAEMERGRDDAIDG